MTRWNPSRRALLSASAALSAGTMVGGLGLAQSARAESAAEPAAAAVGKAALAPVGYRGVPRPGLWSPTAIEYSDTSSYKKEGPYKIGFSNAGLGDSWRVVLLHSMQAAVARNKNMVSSFIVTDANHNDAKQVSDIEDLISQDVDILIVSANTSDALDPVVSRAMRRGIPVVMTDRSVTSGNFVSFAACADAPIGRMMAQWLVEKLDYKGGIIILSGGAGVGPDTNRVGPALEIFAQYPDIKVLDRVYTDFSSAKGKTQMAAMIQKYGDQIKGVFGQFGGQVSGSIEAFVDAGYAEGTIPPHTSTDYNGPLKLATQHKFPLFNFDYPPAMGGESVEIALRVLQGIPVAKYHSVNSQLTITRGDETPSVHADMWADEYLRPDKPNDYLLSGGLGPDYDPATFKVELP
jgi:ribose transport system substrate-binding protein